MRKLCVVLLDGLGDRAYPELGGGTSNEVARTPVLDALCRDGSCGLLWPLGRGRVPASELAHWAMLGMLPEEFPGRAVLEARGHGLELRADAVYGYAALRTVSVEAGRCLVTGRDRDPELPPEHPLRRPVAVDGLSFTPFPVGGGEAVLEVAGPGAEDGVTDTDPFFRERDPLLEPLPCRPEATAMAAALGRWTRGTLGEGRVVTTKWWGRVRPTASFAERHGLAGALVAGSPFLVGLAETVGLEPLPVPDTGDVAADLGARLEAAAAVLAGEATFAWVHTKAVDEAGHTKDPARRVAMIELLDPILAALREPSFADVVVCVTGDHATPCAPELIHSGDPVPFVLHGPGVRADRVAAFGELTCAEGMLGHLTGTDVMPLLLNAADRAVFAGSRPSPVCAPAGHPRPRPLEVS
ncbi:MAG: phosphoglycerate mutase [Gaiella sp.]